jgi:glucose-6-phosphate isomerase
MKSTKKLKEVISQYNFIDLLSESTNQYDLLSEYKQSTILLIGIGGSSLGAKLLAQLSSSKKQVHYLDHLNSNTILDLLSQLDPLDTLLVVQSKSGKTLETISVYNIFKKWLSDNKSSLAKNIIYCSDKGTDLEQEATVNGSSFFELNGNVGGRYSILSCMGLVLATLLKVNIQDILSTASKYNSYLNDIEELAIAIKSNRVKTISIFNYNHKLTLINDWFVQLLSESLGKNGKEYLPLSCYGVKDQHSILQLLEDGAVNKLILFIPPTYGEEIAIPNSNYTINDLLKAEYIGTFESLKSSHLYYEFDDNVNLNKYLGKIIIFLEILVAYLGELNDINPFDQPGVEKSKKIAKLILNKS